MRPPLRRRRGPGTSAGSGPLRSRTPFHESIRIDDRSGRSGRLQDSRRTLAVMNLRELQRPLKQAYRADPTAALLTLRATASEQDSPMACSVDIGRAVYAAQAQAGVGGAGTAACSGD